MLELVCFSTSKDYEDHWEKLGGRYTDNYGSATGQLVLIIIEDYDETNMPAQVAERDNEILTIWIRHDRQFTKVRFNSSLDCGKNTEEISVGTVLLSLVIDFRVGANILLHSNWYV